MEAFTKFRFNEENISDKILKEGIAWVRNNANGAADHTEEELKVVRMIASDWSVELSREQLFNLMSYVAKAIRYQESFLKSDLDL